jgi:hypothetical protein
MATSSVWLYRPDLTRQAVIAPAWEAEAGYRFITLDLELRENSVTELTLVMPHATAPPLDWFPLDALLGVWHGDRLEGDTLWFVRVPPALSYGANGELLVTVKAQHALYLLTGRIVAYAAGSAQTEKTGPGDDLIKAVVRENLGSSAGSRELSNVTVAPDLGQGATVYKTFPRRNVFLVCRELARASAQGGQAIFFDLVWTGSGFEFRTYLGQRGMDHSASGSVPVTLSAAFGSLSDVTRQFDHREEITVVYCGGQGTEDQRLVVSVSDTERLAASPWNRRELWVDARYLALQDSLTTEADGALWRRRPRQTLRGIATSHPGAVYGIHWGYGDLVSAEVDGDVVTARVHAVQIRMADGVRLVRAELRADSVENEDAIRQIEGVLDSSNAEEFPPWSETPAPYTLPLAGAGGTLAAAWLPATVALRSGTPATGRVASWASSTSVGDAGFAASDVARLSQANVFDREVEVGANASGFYSFICRNGSVTTRYAFMAETDAAGRGFQVRTADAASWLNTSMTSGSGNVNGRLDVFRANGTHATAELQIQLLSGGYTRIGGRVYASGLRVNPASPDLNEIYVDANGFLKRG